MWPIIAGLTWFFAGLACVAPSPALVGYGCEGASGPLYADNEDEFPVCKKIEVR